jgi:hypothetical protein
MKPPEYIRVQNYNEAALIMSLYLIFNIPDELKITAILSLRAQILVQHPHLSTKNTQQ